MNSPKTGRTIWALVEVGVGRLQWRNIVSSLRRNAVVIASTALLSCHRKQSVYPLISASVEFHTSPRLCSLSLINQLGNPGAFLRVVPIQQILRASRACATLIFKKRLSRNKQKTRVGCCWCRCSASRITNANVGARCTEFGPLGTLYCTTSPALDMFSEPFSRLYQNQL